MITNMQFHYFSHNQNCPQMSVVPGRSAVYARTATHLQKDLLRFQFLVTSGWRSGGPLRICLHPGSLQRKASGWILNIVSGLLLSLSLFPSSSLLYSAILGFKKSQSDENVSQS